MAIEHILLGLLREGDGVAARVLKNLDIDIEQTRQEILKELDPNFAMSDEEIEEEEEGEDTAPTAVKRAIRRPLKGAFGRDLTRDRTQRRWIR